MSFNFSNFKIFIWFSLTSSISMLPSDRQSLSSNQKYHVQVVFNVSTHGKSTDRQKSLYMNYNVDISRSYKIHDIRSNDYSRLNIKFDGPLIHTFSGQGSSLSELRNDACSRVLNRPDSKKNWVALFNDDNCDENTKSKRAQEAGARAQIMYSSDLKSSKNSKVNVDDQKKISIFVSFKEIQTILAHCYNSSYPFDFEFVARSAHNQTDEVNPKQIVHFTPHLSSICNVSIEVYSTNRDHFLNRTSVLFVSISFILLMIISLAWLVFYYVQRFRYIHVKEEYARRVARLAKKAVAKLELQYIKAGDKETEPDYDPCIICIEPYKVSDSIRKLPCKHFFHKSCIEPWLLDQQNCPICKMNILQHYGMIPGDTCSVISDRDSDPTFGLAIPLNNREFSTGDTSYDLVSGGDSVSTRPTSRITIIQYFRNRFQRRRNSSLNQLGSRETYHLTGSSPTSAIAVNIPTCGENQSDSPSTTSAPVQGGRNSSQSSLEAAGPSVSSITGGDKEVVCLRVQLERTPVTSSHIDDHDTNSSSEEGGMLYPDTSSVVG